jgi:DNA-binding NtrC family response regulator
MADANDIGDFEGRPLSQVLLDVERRYFCWALNKAEGNKAEAARIAGMAYQTFTRKLNLLGLRVTYHAE